RPVERHCVVVERPAGVLLAQRFDDQVDVGWLERAAGPGRRQVGAEQQRAGVHRRHRRQRARHVELGPPEARRLDRRPRLHPAQPGRSCPNARTTADMASWRADGDPPRHPRLMAKPPVVMAAVLLGLAVMTGVVKAWEPEPNPGAGPAERFTFGLWGDMPYAKNGDGPKIPALIADMNADRSLTFTAFDGDTKDGSSPCTDDQYTAAVERFNRFEAPTVYVPGDNEWTDCHRLNNGGYNNLERLDHVRKVMFAGRSSFGLHTMPLVHQGKPGEAYSENTRWEFGDAVFVGLNVPGSNNNRINDPTGPECTDKSARTPADCQADNDEYSARTHADIDWLHQAF